MIKVSASCDVCGCGLALRVVELKAIPCKVQSEVAIKTLPCAACACKEKRMREAHWWNRVGSWIRSKV